MCYICRKPIKGYEHFCQHSHNPGKGCQVNCGQCLTFTNTVQDDEMAVEEVRRQAERELGVPDGGAAAGPAATARNPDAAQRVLPPEDRKRPTWSAAYMSPAQYKRSVHYR